MAVTQVARRGLRHPVVRRRSIADAGLEGVRRGLYGAGAISLYSVGGFLAVSFDGHYTDSDSAGTTAGKTPNGAERYRRLVGALAVRKELSSKRDMEGR